MIFRRSQLKFQTLLIGLIFHTASEGQTLPVVTADSGQFRMHPLVPAAGESTRLSATGDFAFSNSVISVDSFSVEPELIVIDLASAWDTGTSSAADAVTTPWSFEVTLGTLAQDVYDVWIRVNGETFLLSFTIVEAARPDPLPLSDPVPTVTPVRSLGMNLNTLKDVSTMFTLVDVFKTSRAWIPHRPSDDTWDTGEEIDADQFGWVRSLAPDQEAGTLMMAGVGDAYPGGRWTVLYDGDGEIAFGWDARIIDSEPGRLELWVTPEIGMHIIIRETNPADYIRNIRVIMPGFEEIHEEEPFHPTYIEFLKQFSVLRFMDWADSNEPENNVPSAGEWSPRITPDHETQGTVRGVAFEYMIRMANDVRSDPWISVPIVATDEYVDSLATLIRDRLNPNRKVYIELSNEVWNPSFPQHAVAAERGTLLGLADQTAADPYRFIFPDEVLFLNALRYHSQRSVEVFEIFERAFGSRDRLVRVIGGWLPDSLDLATQVAGDLLDWQQASTRADAYAGALYFGTFLASQESRTAVEAMSAETILDTAAADLRLMLEVGAGLSEFISQRDVELMAYESGQSLIQPTETPYPSDLVEEKLTAAQNDERMNGLYVELLNGWAEFGGHMNLYNDSLPHGSFGVVSRWDQLIETAHRYRAVLDFLVTEPPTQKPARIGDGDGDGDVDLDDFSLFSDIFHTADERFDFNADGRVDFRDLFLFADVFGT